MKPSNSDTVFQTSSESVVPDFLLIVCSSSTEAMEADGLLKEQAIEHRFVPTPQTIAHSCGLSLRCSLPTLTQVSELLRKSHLHETAQLYSGFKNSHKWNYSKIPLK